MDAKQIRQQNLVRLINEYGGQAKLAEKVEASAAYFSQILSKKHSATLGDDLARRIEIKLGLDHGWMDISHDATIADNATEEELVEILLKMENSKILDIVARVMRLKEEK